MVFFKIPNTGLVKTARRKPPTFRINTTKISGTNAHGDNKHGTITPNTTQKNDYQSRRSGESNLAQGKYGD
jgi:hypothetical protein